MLNNTSIDRYGKWRRALDINRSPQMSMQEKGESGKGENQEKNW